MTVRSAEGNAAVTLDAHGQYLQAVRSLKAPGPSADGSALPYGLFGFNVTGVTPGGVAAVDMTLPAAARMDGYFKQDPQTGGLYRFDFDGRTGAVVAGNRVTLYLQDGGRGDADGAANGVIVDPGGPGTTAGPVTLEAVAPTSSAAGGVGGFRVWRAGTSGDVTVNYKVGGTAQPGTDYTALAGSVTIKDGNRSAAVPLDPMKFDPATGLKTVTLTLKAGTGYTVGTQNSGSVALGAFTATPVVTVEAAQPKASDVGDPDIGLLTFRRTTTAGDLKVDYAVTGTATPGTDYQPLAGSVVIPAGAQWITVRVRPTTDTAAEGPETVTVTVLSSTRYDLGSATAATVTIDDGGGAGPLDPQVVTKSLPPVELIPLGCGLYGYFMFLPGPAGTLIPYPYSPRPVRYGLGAVRLESDDLGSAGFGLPWGQSRSWSNLDGSDEGSYLGTGWATDQTPYLATNDFQSPVAVVFNGNINKTFDLQPTGYEPSLPGPETLVHDTINHLFTFTDSTGQQIVFFDFDGSYPAKKRGELKKIVDPKGNVTEAVAWDTDGRITEVQRSRTVGGVTTIESYLTTYVAGTNAGRQETVKLQRKVGSGNWEDVRKVEYTYYGASESGGPAGNLKRATVKDPSNSIISVDYYRYFAANEANGYENGLKLFVGGQQYAQMEQDLGGAANVDSASDSTVKGYANNYFEYQSDHRVTKEIASGAGCSACSGGQGTFTFSYTDSMNGQGMNSWQTKTVVTQPDGNQEIVYTNFAGGMMLKAFKDTTTNDIWASFYRFDDDGRVVLEAEPSAVTGWSDTYPDLINYQFGESSYLRDSQGLVSTRTYGGSTTATTSTAGDVAGFFKEAAIRRGESGTSVKQYSATYIKHTANGIDVYPTAEEKVYRNADGTGGQTTTFGYTWISGSNQVEQTTITRPAATTGQNGSGSTDADVVVNDADGRPIWVKDAGGFIHYTEYDLKTGAVAKTIRDVDTSQTSTFSNLPSGWSTPTGGGLHLTTIYEVDGLGRTTKITDPNGNITYITFDDDAHETRVYRGWDSTVPTGPTEVYREDWAHGYRETLTMSATPSLTGGRPNGQEVISGIQSLSREVLNDAGQVVAADTYVDLGGVTYVQDSLTLGTSGTNYHRTQFEYGELGELAKTVTPTGTIYRTVIDGQNRPISRWVGTDDVPTSGEWSPTNTAGTDLVKVWEGQYDSGGVGDGNLTKETEFPGGGAANRVTDHSYDWRNRPVATKQGVEASEGTSLNRPIFYAEYDNLNNVVVSERYDGDSLSIITDSNSDGVPDRPDSGALRAKGTFAFDEQNRPYQQKTFSVEPSNGSVSTNALVTNHWYNSRGLEIKTSRPGGTVTKTEFDGAGRTTKSYVTDGGGDTAYGDADDVTSDNVLSQTEITYDRNSNVTLTTTRERFHDETGTGALGTPSTGVKARVSYAASYFDKADRLTDSVDVGTFGGAAYTRPSIPDGRDDTHLVTSYGYNPAGRLESVTDPKVLVNKTFYDLAGRTTKTIENYVNGVVEVDDGSDVDDKTVEYTYDADGHRKTLKAYLTSTTSETTEWVYGITSPIVSNEILKEMRYPDPSTGGSSSTEKDSYTYNQLGQVLTKTDRNNNVHTYSYDILGRQTAQSVATGSGVDGAVKRIETAYDGQGNAYLITSYDAASAGNIVNQVQREFNGLGQLTKEYQAVSGAVNTSTSPNVQYAYSFTGSGTMNHSRLTSITYPNGRVLTYNYATGLPDAISRLSSFTDGSTTLESYDYLGLGTVVRRAHPQPGVDLTYVKFSGESDGSAGDKYIGLDRFGRVIDQRWMTNDVTPVTKDRWQYGYDRDGNRLYKENLVQSTRSELYAYDGQNQITSMQRGTLNGTKDGLTGSASRSQSWDFDALGNFDSQTTDVTTQTRSHNKQNEITSVQNATTPTYDANGNLTTDETGRTFKYDAWNRLVEVRDSGNNLLATYRYDALGRRVRETRGATTTDLYYSAAWQVLEERVGGVVNCSYVWSPVYVDALIARDRDTNGDGTLDERLYAVQDANWNVVALVDTSGAVVERYAYDAFGGFVVLTPTWGSRASSLYAWKHQHQGLKWDADLGALDNRSRVLSVTLGRFFQPDPIGFGAGDVDLYRYVGNTAPNLSDSSGLWWRGGGIRIKPVEKPELEGGVKPGTSPAGRPGKPSTLLPGTGISDDELMEAVVGKPDGIDRAIARFWHRHFKKCKPIDWHGEPEVVLNRPDELIRPWQGRPRPIHRPGEQTRPWDAPQPATKPELVPQPTPTGPILDFPKPQEPPDGQPRCCIYRMKIDGEWFVVRRTRMNQCPLFERVDGVSYELSGFTPGRCPTP